MSDLVKAYWNCAYPVDTAHGTLAFGDSAMIGRDEAESSDNWRLSPPPKPKAKRTRKPRKPKTSPIATTPAAANAPLSSPISPAAGQRPIVPPFTAEESS